MSMPDTLTLTLSFKGEGIYGWAPIIGAFADPNAFWDTAYEDPIYREEIKIINHWARLKRLHLEDISNIENFTGTAYMDNVIICLLNLVKLKRRHWCVGSHFYMAPFGSLIEGYVLSANKWSILVD